MGLFERLKEGLSKTSSSIANGLDAVFGDYSQVDDEFFEELEEVLIMADVGMKATGEILPRMRSRVYEEHLKKPEDVKRVLAETIAEQLRPHEDAYAFTEQRSVVLVIGVNGVGKTTTIGKLAMKYKNAGKKVILAAADTFRAAAIEQLEVWAERAGVELVSKPEGSDPAAVIYDAVQAFNSHGGDILICDTAGRLHNKKNLMEELGKINRILARSLPDVRKEVLLVLDATTGQNAISQAREFAAVCEPTGIILTKMDGSAKGGIVIAISSEFDIPVKYIGVGEHAEDLQEFDPDAFMRALFQ
ncbi:MAG: signal recognition particle-docking protein FtsY [Lachnospiraceae bacterium]|jgi:fused signal recognition particle receptor|nr:signal recognition particle-docking protein FtsY [Lachnospiraceae bacterium]